MTQERVRAGLERAKAQGKVIREAQGPKSHRTQDAEGS